MMRGLWQVDPHPDGSRVSMRFAYRAQRSIYGGLFAVALRALAPLALRRTLADCRRELVAAVTAVPAVGGTAGR